MMSNVGNPQTNNANPASVYLPQRWSICHHGADNLSWRSPSGLWVHLHVSNVTVGKQMRPLTSQKTTTIQADQSLQPTVVGGEYLDRTRV